MVIFSSFSAGIGNLTRLHINHPPKIDETPVERHYDLEVDSAGPQIHGPLDASQYFILLGLGPSNERRKRKWRLNWNSSILLTPK